MSKIYQYKCTLLSDVILTSMASTEGYKESLTYIPGAKFLGIVARKLYNENSPKSTLDMFHNGTVRFGDATPCVHGEAGLKVPFSWHHEKGKNLFDTIYLHHKITKTDKQVKQARVGYFFEKNNFFVAVEQGFTIKSAYDATKRKSKDSQMYGYFSLKKGTSWIFTVSDNDGQYAEKIKNELIGRKTIGRSTSAEYGLVEIEFLNEIQPLQSETLPNDTLIYAKSNLCFYDDFGKCTATPKVEQLVGTSNANIDWAKSQIRSRNYLTWNKTRNNKDAERLIIESGSVFYIKLNETISNDFLEKGIGSHKSEGLGSVMVNPSFLISENETLNLKLQKNDVDIAKKYNYEGTIEEDSIINLLKVRQQRNSFEYVIDEKVNTFIEKNKPTFHGLSNSQWGILRNYAKNIPNISDFETFVFSETYGFFYRGKSEAEWRKNGRRDKLQNYLSQLSAEEYLHFVVKLSNQMAKSK